MRQSQGRLRLTESDTHQEFQKIVPWLMLNREGLDVLIHPLTENSYDSERQRRSLEQKLGALP